MYVINLSFSKFIFHIFVCYSYIICFHFRVGNPRKLKKKSRVHFMGSYNALRANEIPVNPQIHGNVIRLLFVLNFIFSTIVCTCTRYRSFLEISSRYPR
jgi:hypothetical protein